MAVKQITADQFDEEVINSDIPVLVDFFATWCGPCKMMAPILEELSEEIDTVKFTSIDVDDAERIAILYGISSIPCLILFKNGEEATRSVGAVPKSKLKELLS